MKETPVVVSLVSILFMVSMFMATLPFRLMNVRIKDKKLFATRQDLRTHLYGDARQATHEVAQ